MACGLICSAAGFVWFIARLGLAALWHVLFVLPIEFVSRKKRSAPATPQSTRGASCDTVSTSFSERPSPVGTAPTQHHGTKLRVAVIGGGIAGCGAAYSLAKSGAVEVTLFEERGILGGNAKTNAWEEFGGVRTGLSVLAWPAEYFRHYTQLLKDLGIPTVDVQPTFWVDTDRPADASPFWAHADAASKVRWATDMKKWDNMVAFTRSVNEGSAQVSQLLSIPLRFIVRVVNKIFGLILHLVGGEKRKSKGFEGRQAKKTDRSSGKGEPNTAALKGKPSFYKVTLLNPMNLIPIRLLSKVFGISDSFWEYVVVPVYSSSFLTCHLNDTPAVILPALDDIISVGAGPVKTLKTWAGSSKDVFDAMARVIGSQNIELNAAITHVSPIVGYGCENNGIVITYKGGAKTAHFDRVIFACPSRAVDNLSKGTTLRSHLFDQIIPSILYENERDDSFTFGVIHSNRSVIPSQCHEKYFGRRYSNYLKVRKNPDRSQCKLENLVENTFTLGTWVPQAVSAAGGLAAEPFDCFVTYNGSVKIPEAEQLGIVDNTWAHPQLSLKMMTLAASVGLLQGRHNVYYCGSYTTPGNGHDLSLLSGFVVAHAVISKAGHPEAAYPFAAVGDPRLHADFKQLQALMGFW
jgi:predicted NAD/FAD-binding protein